MSTALSAPLSATALDGEDRRRWNGWMEMDRDGRACDDATVAGGEHVNATPRAPPTLTERCAAARGRGKRGAAAIVAQWQSSDSAATGEQSYGVCVCPRMYVSTLAAAAGQGAAGGSEGRI